MFFAARRQLSRRSSMGVDVFNCRDERPLIVKLTAWTVVGYRMWRAQAVCASALVVSCENVYLRGISGGLTTDVTRVHTSIGLSNSNII